MKSAAATTEPRRAVIERSDLPWPPRNRRELIEHARLSYEAHMGVMVEWYPETRVTPWDDQDAAVREAWIEHVTPEERSFA